MALTFARERFHDVEDDLRLLVPRHWREVADNQDSMKLDVDWEKFRTLEESGMLLVVTARDEDVFAGYVIHVVAPSVHYRTHLIARDDAHYLAPAYRQAWNAFALLRATERELASFGVSAISYHHKVREDLDKGPLFKRLGYALQEKIYTKFL